MVIGQGSLRGSKKDPAHQPKNVIHMNYTYGANGSGITQCPLAHRKLQKDDVLSWDETLNKNQSSLQVGAKGRSQGTQVYMVKCQELGVVPSTQVHACVCACVLAFHSHILGLVAYILGMVRPSSVF